MMNDGENKEVYEITGDEVKIKTLDENNEVIKEEVKEETKEQTNE
jgi:hypothetical protein